MHLVLCFFASVAFACGSFAAQAQQAPGTAGKDSLPTAPVAANAGALLNGSATLSGTVMDANGAEVEDARVDLKRADGEQVRSAQSSSDGEFSFTVLPPGSYILVVSGPGWGTYTSPEIQLRDGDFQTIPNVVLPLTASAVVRVSADREELSEQQVQIAEHQRVLGVIPNFYSSYDWNAPPMQAKQKIQLTLRSLIDPMEFASVAGMAAVEQKMNTFSSYGTGAEGYGKRLGAAYVTDFSAEFLAYAAFPALFHQDPRYFYKGTGSFGSRAFYALSSSVVTRGDNGRRQPNYSYILGSFAAGALSNLYYPSADRGVKLTMLNGLADIGAHAGSNLVREFVLKRFTHRAQEDTDTQP